MTEPQNGAGGGKRHYKPSHYTKQPDTRPTSLTPHVRAQWLGYLAEGWSVSKACRATNSSREAWYDLRARDPQFRAQWEQALVEGNEYIEDAARERGVDGVEEPVYQGGELVGFKQRYSDTLLQQQLEARMPDRYRRRLDVANSGNPMLVQNNAVLMIAASVAPDDAARMYAKLLSGTVADLPVITDVSGSQEP